MSSWFRGVADEMATVQQRIAAIESRSHGGEDNGSRPKASLIHMNMITPSTLSQTEHWKEWKGDIGEYCEETCPGMKDTLDRAKKAEDDYMMIV